MNFLKTIAASLGAKMIPRLDALMAAGLLPQLPDHVQHTNPLRNKQRKVCKRLGHRQYRIKLKAFRRVQAAQQREQQAAIAAMAQASTALGTGSMYSC